MEGLCRAAVRLLPVPVGIYFYFYLRRAVSLLGFRMENGWVRILTAGLAACLALPAADIWSIGAVVSLHLAAGVFVTDLVCLALRRTGHLEGRAQAVYRSGIVPVLLLAGALVYGWWNMRHVVRTQYTVYTEKAIRPRGYRIAMLSDLHYGTTMGAGALGRLCARIEAERPDLLILNGDLVDEHTTGEELAEVFEILSGIRTEYGIFYVYGNHDRGSYVEHPDFTPEELEASVLDAQIHILREERVTVGEEAQGQKALTLIGRDDRTNPGAGKRKKEKELLQGADMEDFLILLEHQPRELQKHARAGYDLQLSGHTHGGQIWPVGLGKKNTFGELVYGMEKRGDFCVIVTSGAGGWQYPLRTGRHSEYVLVDILPES